MELYLICEDSLEGIFSGIYEAYALRRPHDEIHIQIGEEENYRLFAEYCHVTPDPTHAAKVARTIGKRFGADGYMTICRALASSDRTKGEAVYRVIVGALSQTGATTGAAKKAATLDNLSDPHIMKIFELARACGNEIHHLLGFIRFRELESGLLYARIGPKNDVLTFVMPHFADRLPQENFIIHDELRDLYGLHPAKQNWFVVTGDEGLALDQATHTYSADELAYSELFGLFFRSISIKERENAKLQRSNLPLRHRGYMTEFM